jgi:plastocyanin
MAKLGWSSLAILAVLIGWPAAAQAQVVQDCQPNQYLDRTAAGADRQLTWDFGIAIDPERCMQVRTGQTVVWNGDMDTHPLAGQGGDMPNPISFHQNGSVTFNTVGTFGFVCLNHSTMKGAIKVVAGPAVPAVSTWMAIALTLLLLASGWILIRREAAPVRARGET